MSESNRFISRLSPGTQEGFRMVQKSEEEYRRYQAEKARRQMIRKRLHENHQLFLETEGLYIYDPEGSISSQELYRIYKEWCIREKIPIKPAREFWLYVKDCAPSLGLTYSGNIIDSTGKRCRGFRGIRSLKEGTDNTHN